MSKKTRKAQLRYAIERLARHERIFAYRRVEMDALQAATKGIHKLLSNLPESAWLK
jgi:ribosomal protein L4